MLPYNKNLKHYSRNLRKDMTEAEKLIWSKIRHKQLKGNLFYRQKTIGNYIADFYCAKAGLVIELDGGQHYSIQGEKRDAIRDNFMVTLGLKVLRFSDADVFKNTNGVLDKIIENLP